VSPPGECPLRLPPSVQETIRSLHPDLKRRVHGALDELRRRPARGKLLVGELSGWRSWRVGKIRVIYRERHSAIEVAAIGPRATIYFEAVRRLQRR
jgi:mRNA-degrading endonuclease RelE of RelBE toxin-antitoxin system